MKNEIMSLIAVAGIAGCSQTGTNPSVRRDANYLVKVAGDSVFARAFDRDGIQSVEITTPNGTRHNLYSRTSDEVDYKLFTKVANEKVQRGVYTLTVTDIFGETETIATDSRNIEKVPHPNWASP